MTVSAGVANGPRSSNAYFFTRKNILQLTLFFTASILGMNTNYVSDVRYKIFFSYLLTW